MKTKAGSRIEVNPQFQRSIRVDTDFAREDALAGYVRQPTGLLALGNVARQVNGSQQRAFTWTGPYGTGKSSLALALAQLAGGSPAARKSARIALGDPQGEVATAFCTRKPWLALPLVGRREPIEAAIAESIDRWSRMSGRRPLRDGRRNVIAELIRRAESGTYAGVLVILDELGKFLEGSVARGEDIFFLQELAEAASRCEGKLVIIGVLHQSFDQYAAKLGREAQNEWAKIQGRFVDIPIVAGVDEVIGLIGGAISTNIEHAESMAQAKAVADAVRARRPTSPIDLAQSLDRCWPLHPVTAALLGPSSRRKFGQNERSVFGFLGSPEPHGFREFIQSRQAGETYRPSMYWDYLRANFEPAILSSPDGHRWALIADAVERAEARLDSLHVELLKAAGLIELFRNGSGLAAEERVLHACVQGASKAQVNRALEELSKSSMLVYRKHLQSWCVYAGSDFDIEASLTSAKQVTGAAIEAQLRSLSVLPPLTARRHYFESGTLRWFDREVMLAEAAAAKLPPPSSKGQAGRFILLLPTRDCPVSATHALAERLSKEHAESTSLFGVPSTAVNLSELASELAALNYVWENYHPIHGDAIAKREIEARTQQTRLALEEALRDSFNNARWYVAGKAKDVTPASGLSPLASEICQKVYRLAPKVHSELINRDAISSNSVKAQKNLMHRMVEFETVPGLGYEGYPADAGLYYTTIDALGLHKQIQGRTQFVPPDPNQAGGVGPLWTAWEHMLANADGPVTLTELGALAKAPPFGVKSGLVPILALAFLLTHRNELGVYVEGTFVPEVTSVTVDEWLQDPSRIAWKWVPMDEASRKLLAKLASRLTQIAERPVAIEALDSARALVSLILTLPGWTRRTQRVSARARDLRSALLTASDPIKVLYVDLPEILGPMTSVDQRVDAVASVLEELRAVYPATLKQMTERLLASIDHQGSLEELWERARRLRGSTGNFLLDAFASRLEGFTGADIEVESLISLATNKPPREFTDHDLDSAQIQLTTWALDFRRVEAMTAINTGGGSRRALALVFGSGQTISRTIDVAVRDTPFIHSLAMDLLHQARASGVARDVLLAALAEAGATLLAEDQVKETA